MYATDRKKVRDVAENTDSVMVLGVVVQVSEGKN